MQRSSIPGEAASGPRLLVVCNEPPWPATHGGRVDQWNRYAGLKALGWSLALLTWSTPGSLESSPADIDAMHAIFDLVLIAAKPHGVAGAVRRLGALPTSSTHVSSRRLDPAQRAEALEATRAFAPQAVMLDAIYGFEIADVIARELGIALLLRSNNIEHVYMAAQAAAARTLRQSLQLRLAALHLPRFERKVHARVAWNFDCSADDLQFWRSEGLSNNAWAPPIFPRLAAGSDQARVPAYDFVYLGNLNTPNNVEGIGWLLSEVLPRIWAQGTTPTVLLAGSNPTDHVRAAAASAPGVTLLVNPPDAAEVRRTGRVLLNPILRGSGINVKSVEMLYDDAAIVTTRIGVQGMSAEAQQAFITADDPTGFAEAMIHALSTPYQPSEARARARELFGARGIEAFADHLASFLGPPGGRGSAGMTAAGRD